ncbi:MAG: transporter substrate-binding domain-containing protein [Balneolales bacterium]
MKNFYYHLIRNLAALTVVTFIIAPANIDIIEVKEYEIITEVDPIPDNSLNLSLTEAVDLDFQEILDRGTIRMITNYNIGSYFLRGGLDRGFEYEFFSTFARQHDLTVEVIVLQPDDNPVDVLNSGEGDIIAANFIKTSMRDEQVSFSEPYNMINQHIILPNERYDITELDELENITISVRRNSAHHETLLGLKKQGYSFDLDLVSETIEKEALIVGVAEGRYQATVSDDHQFNILKTYVTGVHLGPKISNNDPVGWGVRHNASQLKKEVDKYTYGNFKHDPKQNKNWKSGYLTLLQDRYFNNPKLIEQNRRDIHKLMYHGVMSPYDQLIRPVADDAGVDWKLAIAVMAQESSFRPGAVSIAGAVGLMQIIPRFSQVSDKSGLMDPKTNIGEGMRYITNHLNHYSYLDTENQLALTLATYNAGMGHLADARRLTIDSNKDPNNWGDVSEALLKLMDRKYYNNARYGFCRGTETVDYVEKVTARYKTYQAISQLANSTGKEDVEETILAMGKIGK